MTPLGRLFTAGLGLLFVIAVGTAGYMSIENYSFIDGLYMTVITIATIGFMEVHPLSENGRIFTIFLGFAGTALMLLYVGIQTQFILEGQFRRIFGRKRVERAVSRMKNHYILCGAGRIGQLIAMELRKSKFPFVIIERSPENFERMQEAGYICMQGDASNEEILRLAHIDTAKSLILALASDAETVYTILTARQLNPGLFIIARANDIGSERKITMAGANRVVSHYHAVSYRMVNAILRPEVVDMLELTFQEDNLDIALEGVTVPSRCMITGKSVVTSNIRAGYGVTIVGIKKSSGKTILGPGPHDLIEGGDVLILAGRKADVDKLIIQMNREGTRARTT